MGWADAVGGKGRLIFLSPVAPCDQRKVRGRTDGRVGIRLGEAHALGGKAIQVRGLVLGLAVDAEVSPAEVISENEENVGSGIVGLTHCSLQTSGVECEPRRSGHRILLWTGAFSLRLKPLSP